MWNKQRKNAPDVGASFVGAQGSSYKNSLPNYTTEIIIFQELF